jgi:hypothetical protein
MERMTRSERAELMQVAKMRGKVAKTEVEARGREQMARIEAEFATQYSEHHEAWQHIAEEAKVAVNRADQGIAALCRKMGVPESFRPQLSVSWHSRGENAESYRRAQLRVVAESRIAANVRNAKVQIDREVSRVCTDLVAEGLTTEKARESLDSLPSIDGLMPPLTLPDIEQTKALADRSEHDLGYWTPD